MNDTLNIQKLRATVAPLASQYGVERMYLFVSRARGEITARTEITIS